MADEGGKTPAEAETTTVPSENVEGENNVEGKGEGGEGGERNDRRRQRDERPIEELYDLSKPIPKVQRPSKEEHEAALAEKNAEIDNLKEERKQIQAKIDAAMEGSRNSDVAKEREVLTDLKAQKGRLIDEKKQIRSRLEATKQAAEKMIKDKNDTRSSIKFSRVEDIDVEIAKLQRRQETTSMSLSEEKRLIKEMEALQASKLELAKVKSKETSIDNAKEERKIIAAEIAAKDKEIDEIQEQINVKQSAMNALRDKESEGRDAVKALFTERDEIKKKISERLDERNAMREAFRDANNAWYNFQRAVRAQRKMEYEKERAARDAERDEWLKKKEEEEMKKVPYEEEQALCDYLADYLERTYLSDGKEGDKSQPTLRSAKKDEVVEVKDDPFANFKPVNKKEDDVFLKMGKTKNPRKRGGKKGKATNFTLNVDSFEQFGLLGLTPPTSLDMVEDSVKELREKKEWFSKQPRGSVPTAQQIRKQNEQNANRLRKNDDDGDKEGKADKGPKKKGTAFSLSDDDFVPLGSGAAAASMNSTWGKSEEGGADEDGGEGTGGEVE